jgi:hypothetical protein
MSTVLPPVRRDVGWRVLVVDTDSELVDRVLVNAQEVADVRVARASSPSHFIRLRCTHCAVTPEDKAPHKVTVGLT